MSRKAICICLSEEATEILGNIAGSLGLSKSEVVRRALVLFVISHKERMIGNKTVIAKNGEIIKEIIGIFE